MAKKVLVKATLQEAGNVKTVWESNPGFTLGKTGLNDFIAVYEATEGLDKDYAKKDVELSGVREQRDDKARELGVLITRFRSAVRGAYGPDSAEYSQAGGTRTSARKSPTRKPNTTAKPQA